MSIWNPPGTPTGATVFMADTSITSFAVGTGSKTFVTQLGAQFVLGQWVLITSAANTANWMYGQVTVAAVNSLTVNVTVVGGTGTHIDWIIAIAGVQGTTGAAGTGITPDAVGFHATGGTTPHTLTVDADFTVSANTTALAAKALLNGSASQNFAANVLTVATAAGTSIAIESVIAPTLLNSWVNFGATSTVAGYYKDACGIVHIQGSIKSGTIGATAFILPSGYRPVGGYIFFSTYSSGLVATEIYIYTDGTVVINAGNNAQMALDGITFRTT